MHYVVHMTALHEVGNIPEFGIGDRLRKAREVTGMERAEFAHHIGINRNTITNYEGNKVKTREVVLRAWALGSGVPLHWIVTGHAETPGPDGPGVCEECAARDSNPEPSDYSCVVYELPKVA